MMNYQVGDRVLYQGYKYAIIYISRMGEIMINILGYNKWVCHLELKPIKKCYATLMDKTNDE